VEIDESGSDVKGNGQLRACAHCAARFYPRRSDRRFCSDRCRLRNWRRLQSALAQTTDGNNPATGIAARLRIYLARSGPTGTCELTAQELRDLLVETASLGRVYVSIQQAYLVLQSVLATSNAVRQRRSGD
jgi:hypothetical protein